MKFDLSISDLLKKLSRVIVLFILLIFPLQLFADTISIATFNIRIFSNNSRDESELYQICNLIKEFDFIAFQEIPNSNISECCLGKRPSVGGFNWQYKN